MKPFADKYKTYWKQNYSSWILFVVITFCVFVQTAVCQRGVLGWPIHAFWASVFVGSLAFITCRRWVSWLVITLYSVWCMTLVIYFRANELMFNVNALLMASNMRGFWSAIWAYVDWTVCLLALIPLAYGVFLCFIPRLRTRLWWEYAGVLGLCAIVSVWKAIVSFPKDSFQTYKEHIDFYLDNGGCDSAFGLDHGLGRYGEKWFIPFYQAYHAAELMDLSYPRYYFSTHGALHYLPAMIANYWGDTRTEVEPVSPAELTPYWNPSVPTPKPKYNVIMILTESLETWPLELGEYSKTIAPALAQWTQTDHVTYVPTIYSQVRHGVSGDGQMLLNSGLLPITNGATCMLYSDNTFPNIASCYPYSATIDPYANNNWNQTAMTTAYGYQTYVSAKDIEWSDLEMFQTLVQVLDTIHEPFCIQGITKDMHTPFSAGRDLQLGLPEGMPTYMHDYIGCYHIVDCNLGWLLEQISKKVNMNRTVIVITADHSIFKSNLLESFEQYAQIHHFSIPAKRSYCPCWIYIPNQPNRQINGVFYQMDLYPTVLAALGLQSHPWKGFGINLLDEQQRQQRDTVNETYYQQLSNRIIIHNALSTRF